MMPEVFVDRVCHREHANSAGVCIATAFRLIIRTGHQLDQGHLEQAIRQSWHGIPTVQNQLKQHWTISLP